MLKIKLEKALSHFNLQIDMSVDNQRVVLFGPSGSGKTSLLNCIAGIQTPDTGEISLNDQLFFSKTKKVNLPIQKRGIGYLFQEYALFPHLTVKKNIHYNMKDADMVEKLMEIVKIKHLLDKYPHQISGGEKQRVALVRALATKPSLLLLDEPFSALDDEVRRESQDELLRIHRIWQIPMLIVTHDRSEAEKLGQEIYHIKDGQIIL